MKKKTQKNQLIAEPEDNFANVEPRLDVTSEDLQKVFHWSPTQIKKIDLFLKQRLKGIWPATKKKVGEFYDDLLGVVDQGEGLNLALAMNKLQEQQPKNKKKKNVSSISGPASFYRFTRWHGRWIRKELKKLPSINLQMKQ